jgi:hypothetical protein
MPGFIAREQGGVRDRFELHFYQRATKGSSPLAKVKTDQIRLMPFRNLLFQQERLERRDEIFGELNLILWRISAMRLSLISFPWSSFVEILVPAILHVPHV